jgi:hypothetical protein
VQILAIDDGSKPVRDAGAFMAIHRCRTRGCPQIIWHAANLPGLCPNAGAAVEVKEGAEVAPNAPVPNAEVDWAAPNAGVVVPKGDAAAPPNAGTEVVPNPGDDCAG